MKKLIIGVILSLFCVGNVGAIIVGGARVESGGGSTGQLFGDNSITNAAILGTVGADTVRADVYTATASGTLMKGYMYQVINDGDNVKQLVYLNSTGALLATSDVVAGISGVPKFQLFTYSGGNQVAITLGTDYRFGFITDNNWSLSGENSVGNYHDDTGGSYASPPDPYTEGTEETRRLIQYVTGGD